jgi:hypothetical protein
LTEFGGEMARRLHHRLQVQAGRGDMEGGKLQEGVY